MGQEGPPGARKMSFCKNDCGRHGMPKQVFLARFELIILALQKSQNALKTGSFRTKNWSKLCQKWVKNVFFPKMILDHVPYTNKPIVQETSTANEVRTGKRMRK